MLENQDQRIGMSGNQGVRVAIAYDFDGTLAPGNMQEYSFLAELGMSKEDFWEEAEELSQKEDMDHVLAYMLLMLRKVQLQKNCLSYEFLKEHGKSIALFEGVVTWFARMNEYAWERGIVLEHYILSSGLREMIEGTAISHEFKHIFASRFIYGSDGFALWPGLAVNYTNKTQYLFRISRGIMNSHDREKVNQRIAHKNLEILFRNMIYIGDGESDIPCMEILKLHDGKVILVYPPGDSVKRNKIERLFREDGRGDFLAPGDYREKTAIDELVKGTLDRISLEGQVLCIQERLEKYSRKGSI